MNTLTLDEILQKSSFETLLMVFGHVANVLIGRSGEAGELTDLPVRNPETGELVGWLRSFRAEVARMEAAPGFRESLELSAQSPMIDIGESKLLRPISRPAW